MNLRDIDPAMLKADYADVCDSVRTDPPASESTISIGPDVFTGQCRHSDTDNDRGRALALAICRAIVAAMKAREE